MHYIVFWFKKNVYYLLKLINGCKTVRVIITEHAKKRLKDYRQDKIEISDIVLAAKQIPGYVPTATRLRGFISKSGRMFDIVAKDIETGRLVITVIGK